MSISSRASSTDASLEKGGGEVTPPAVESYITPKITRGPRWFRGTLWQATVVGACAFLSPGIWGAMNSLGAGGAQEPYLVNAANSLTFGLMVFTCLFASSLVNRIGYRWALVIGTVGYAPYAAGLYLNKTKGVEWFVLFGAALCGLSAGLFWGVEGAIVLGYPEEHKRGKYLAYWLSWRNGGVMLGGIVNLALNVHNSKAGSVSSNTYLVFIALQAFAPLVALFLSNPEKVIRDDGTPVLMKNKMSFKTEMQQMWNLMRRREVLFLVPMAIYAQWSASYVGTFLSLYFSVRSRALASFLVAVAGVGANFMLGIFLDHTGIRKAVRARGSFAFVMILTGGCWVWFTILQVRFIKKKPPTLDWSQKGGNFGSAFALYIIWYCAYYLIQNEMYWLMSQLARHPQELVRLSSFLRGLESAGAAAAFGVSSRKKLSKAVPLSLNFGLWGIATFFGFFTVRHLGIKEYKLDVKEEVWEEGAVLGPTERETEKA